MAGIIISTKFKVSGAGYSKFVNYLDRASATEYQGYIPYLDNEEKSYGLFHEGKDSLTEEEKKQIKKNFKIAEDNHSILWQSVISFEDDWLIDNGLLDPKTWQIDEKKIMEYTRKTVGKIKEKEGIENAIWSGAIHKNTDHFHVHIAMAEMYPCVTPGQGRCRINQKGEIYQRGKFKNSTHSQAKSTFVNLAISQSLENTRINEIIRDSILHQLKETPLSKDAQLKKQFKKLADQLPNDLCLLKYNNNAMNPFRAEIDALTEGFVNAYFKEDMKELKALLSIQEERYAKAYGKKRQSYAATKINDLQGRMGNTVLKEIANYKKSKRKSVLDYNKSKKKYKTYYPVNSAIYNARKALTKDIQSMKNQRYYQQLEHAHD